LFIVGLPALWTDLKIAELTFVVGIPFLIIATLAAIFTSLDNKIRFWEGAGMLFLYFVFLGKVVQII
jgi:Ca2+/Na+ antiporter